MGTDRVGNTVVVLASFLALSACQSTIGDAPGIGTGGLRPDAAPGSTGLDAAEPDAQPVPPADDDPASVTLRQTESDQILDGHSVTCTARDGGNNSIRNLENSFYRVFVLDESTVQGDLSVSSVQIGIESATTSDNGAQAGTVRLHTLEGNLSVANLTEIASREIQIEPQALSSIEVPITATVPAGSNLVVELLIPESPSGGTLFFIGSNDLGESAPGYLRAPAAGCDIPEPTQLAAIDEAFADIHIVMSVTGSY